MFAFSSTVCVATIWREARSSLASFRRDLFHDTLCCFGDGSDFSSTCSRSRPFGYSECQWHTVCGCIFAVGTNKMLPGGGARSKFADSLTRNIAAVCRRCS